MARQGLNSRTRGRETVNYLESTLVELFAPLVGKFLPTVADSDAKDTRPGQIRCIEQLAITFSQIGYLDKVIWRRPTSVPSIAPAIMP